MNESEAWLRLEGRRDGVADLELSHTCLGLVLVLFTVDLGLK